MPNPPPCFKTGWRIAIKKREFKVESKVYLHYAALYSAASQATSHVLPEINQVGLNASKPFRKSLVFSEKIQKKMHVPLAFMAVKKTTDKYLKEKVFNCTKRLKFPSHISHKMI